MNWAARMNGWSKILKNSHVSEEFDTSFVNGYIFFMGES